jgi:hypothetical protein
VDILFPGRSQVHRDTIFLLRPVQSSHTLLLSSEEACTLERNPYSPPSALVVDIISHGAVKTPWGRAAGFYWAFLWRAVVAFLGMCIPFAVMYPVVKFILEPWPVFEALFRLACILALFTVASCLAIRWAAESSFRGYLLRILDTTNATDSRQSSLPNGISLGRAGRLYGAHIWRYILVAVPINLALTWYFFGPGALQAHDWVTVLKVQSMTVPSGFIVGVWAMRAALGAPYRDFRFQWIAAESSAHPSHIGPQPGNSSAARPAGTGAA